MIYFHGGGYIAGTLDTEDAHCRIFATKVPCLVISVNYPKAPRVKMDGIVDAGASAVEWVSSASYVFRSSVCNDSLSLFTSTPTPLP